MQCCLLRYANFFPLVDPPQSQNKPSGRLPCASNGIVPVDLGLFYPLHHRSGLQVRLVKSFLTSDVVGKIVLPHRRRPDDEKVVFLGKPVFTVSWSPSPHAPPRTPSLSVRTSTIGMKSFMRGGCSAGSNGHHYQHQDGHSEGISCDTFDLRRLC